MYTIEFVLTTCCKFVLTKILFSNPQIRAPFGSSYNDWFWLDVEQDYNAKLEHVFEDFIVLSLDIMDEI